jgi:hypothetical protein
MLDQKPSIAEQPLKLFSGAAADWQVGETPGKWDVSFGERLWAAVGRWFSREPANRIKIEAGKKVATLRRAA